MGQDGGGGGANKDAELAELRLAVVSQAQRIDYLVARVRDLETAVAVAATAFHEVIGDDQQLSEQGDGGA